VEQKALSESERRDAQVKLQRAKAGARQQFVKPIEAKSVLPQTKIIQESRAVQAKQKELKETRVAEQRLKEFSVKRQEKLKSDVESKKGSFVKRQKVGYRTITTITPAVVGSGSSEWSKITVRDSKKPSEPSKVIYKAPSVIVTPSETKLEIIPTKSLFERKKDELLGVTPSPKKDLSIFSSKTDYKVLPSDLTPYFSNGKLDVDKAVASVKQPEKISFQSLYRESIPSIQKDLGLREDVSVITPQAVRQTEKATAVIELEKLTKTKPFVELSEKEFKARQEAGLVVGFKPTDIDFPERLGERQSYFYEEKTVGDTKKVKTYESKVKDYDARLKDFELEFKKKDVDPKTSSVELSEKDFLDYEKRVKGFEREASKLKEEAKSVDELFSKRREFESGLESASDLQKAYFGGDVVLSPGVREGLIEF